MQQLIMLLIAVLLPWCVKLSAVKSLLADKPVSGTLFSGWQLLLCLSCSALKRLLKLLGHNNCEGPNGGSQLETAARMLDTLSVRAGHKHQKIMVSNLTEKHWGKSVEAEYELILSSRTAAKRWRVWLNSLAALTQSLNAPAGDEIMRHTCFCS